MMRKRNALLALAILGGFATTTSYAVNLPDFKPYVQVGGKYEDTSDGDARTQDVKKGFIVVGTKIGEKYFVQVGEQHTNFKYDLDKYGHRKYWTNIYGILGGVKLSDLTLYGVFGKTASNNKGSKDGFYLGAGLIKPIRYGHLIKADINYWKANESHTYYRWQGTVTGVFKLKDFYGIEVIPSLELQAIKKHKSKAYANIRVGKAFTTQYGEFTPYVYGGIGEKRYWMEHTMFFDMTGRTMKGNIGVGVDYAHKVSKGIIGVSLQAEYDRWRDYNSKKTFEKLKLIEETFNGRLGR
jgi:hypothetical protein